MKRILLIICGTGLYFSGFSQTMKASIGPGATPDKVIIYIRSDLAVNGTISTLAFNIAVPQAADATTLAVTQTLLPGFAWTLGLPYTEAGYRHYSLTTGSSPTVTMAANTETPVLEITFTGGGAGVANAYLLTLPDGGATDGNALFYCSGAANSNGSDLYYTRTGPPVTTVQNGFSYRHTAPDGSGITDGTDISYATMAAGGPLPVTFSNYQVKCNDKGVILAWSTATEQNSDKFEIQKSTNGNDWTVLGSVKAAGNSNDSRSYTYLDLNGAGATYYRIRQVDLDGRFIYTNIKRTDCSSGEMDVVLYPVPAKDKLTVAVRAQKAVRTDLQVIDMSGKIVNRITTQINRGNNIVTLDVSKLSAGQYLLSSSDGGVLINKKFTVIR